MTRQILALRFVMLVAATLMSGQTDSSRHSTVPEMDGGAGPCSCQLTVLTPDGKPAGAADVKVHIAYGFGGFHRLDLDAGTNYDGKVNFTGLPAKVKNPPLEFHASKDQWTGVVTFDPAVECQAKHDITMQKADSGQK